MAKLQDCQFIKIEVDGKAIKGSSVETKYKDWMEGYAEPGLSTAASLDGVHLYPCSLKIVFTKDSGKLFETYLKRGYKELTITVVHRKSDEHNGDYEAQNTVYHGCKIQSLNIDSHDSLYMDVDFIFEKTLEVTFTVPNADGSGLDKVGPTRYDIPKKELL